MAIVTIKEVARVGDEFYLPGRYEIPDQALFYNRKAALIDFLSSSLTTAVEEGVRINGLMVIESKGFTLKRNDTVIARSGLSATVDLVGNIVLTDSKVYTVVKRQPYASRKAEAYIDLSSEEDVSITPNAWTRSEIITGGLRVYFDKTGDVEVLLNGEPAGTEHLEVLKLTTEVENNKKGTEPVVKVTLKENGNPVSGLNLVAQGVNFYDEVNGVYYGALQSIDEPVTTKEGHVKDSRPWDNFEITFTVEALKDFTLEGVPTVASMEPFLLTAVPTPEFTFGDPEWSAIGASLSVTGRVCSVTPTSNNIAITATWQGVTKKVELTVDVPATDFTVSGIPEEVENGKAYPITVTPVPENADGRASFSSSIDGVSVTDHMNNKGTINVNHMTKEGVITVNWDELSKDFNLKLKAIPLTVTVDPANIVELNAGETATLRVIWSPESPSDVVWTPSDANLLTVTENSESSVTFTLSEQAPEGSQWFTVKGGDKELKVTFKVNPKIVYKIIGEEGSPLVIPNDGSRIGTLLRFEPEIPDDLTKDMTVVSKTKGVTVKSFKKYSGSGSKTYNLGVNIVATSEVPIGSDSVSLELTVNGDVYTVPVTTRKP